MPMLPVVYVGPFTNVTVTPIFTTPAVAVTVFVSAVLLASVTVHIPAAFVLPLLTENVLLLPVLPMLTGCPGMGLPLASSTRKVNAVTLVPLADTVFGLAVSVDITELGEPATNVTADVKVIVAVFTVTVSACAFVEVKTLDNTPEAAVVPLIGVNVLVVPDALNVAACPGTGLP